MKFSRAYFNQLLSPRAPNVDDRRLVLAGLPVYMVAAMSVFLVYAQARRLMFMDVPAFEKQLSGEKKDEKIYPVLVEQNYRPKPETDQYRALSDVSAEGKGFLTLNPGFHALTPYDRLELSAASRGSQSASSDNSANAAEGQGGKQGGNTGSNAPGNIGDDANFRIPQNYRFRQDFALRYDGSSRLSLARKELAGFRYFQKMIRQIEENFSPPGLNYAYRDNAGLVTSEPVIPQSVQVLFMLDPEGNVRDVRKVSSIGQKAVDDACVNVLKGQNFGVPPPEIFAQGNIFGINFIFPPVVNY